MVRTTDLAVAGIIEVDSSIPLTPFIELATEIVDDHCLQSSYSVAKLEKIERWLAAHFYALRDRRVQSETAGPVSETKETPVLGKLLHQTTYGQTAMLIDTAGNLALWNQNLIDGIGGTPGVLHMGSSPDDSWASPIWDANS